MWRNPEEILFLRVYLEVFLNSNASEPGYILGHSPDFYAASNPSVRHWNCRVSESDSSHLCSWEPVTHTLLVQICISHLFNLSHCSFLLFSQCDLVLTQCDTNMEICYASTCMTGTVDGNCEDSVYYYQINSKSNCCCPCYVISWLGVPFV